MNTLLLILVLLVVVAAVCVLWLRRGRKGGVIAAQPSEDPDRPEST